MRLRFVNRKNTEWHVGQHGSCSSPCPDASIPCGGQKTTTVRRRTTSLTALSRRSPEGVKHRRKGFVPLGVADLNPKPHVASGVSTLSGDASKGEPQMEKRATIEYEDSEGKGRVELGVMPTDEAFDRMEFFLGEFGQRSPRGKPYVVWPNLKLVSEKPRLDWRKG